MIRLPPETDTGGGDDNREPHWSTKLDGDSHRFQFVFGVAKGNMELKKTKRGVDVMLYCKLDQLRVSNNFQIVVNAMRGWRSVQACKPLLRYDYKIVPADYGGGYFVVSLAPGYYITEKSSKGIDLYWRDDVGVLQTQQPVLEPEVRHLTPVRTKPKLLRKRLSPEPPKPKSQRSIKPTAPTGRKRLPPV